MSISHDTAPGHDKLSGIVVNQERPIDLPARKAILQLKYTELSNDIS